MVPTGRNPPRKDDPHMTDSMFAAVTILTVTVFILAVKLSDR